MKAKERLVDQPFLLRTYNTEGIHMGTVPTKFVVTPPQFLRIGYVVTGVFGLMALVMFLTGSIFIPVLMLAAVGASLLLWNPLMTILVDSSTVTLIRKHGPHITLTRATLAAMAEYRFGRIPQNTGIRFTTRAGSVYETGGLSDAARRDIGERIAAELQLNPRDLTEGFRSWSA